MEGFYTTTGDKIIANLNHSIISHLAYTDKSVLSITSDCVINNISII